MDYDYVAMGYIITNTLIYTDGASKHDLIGGSVLYTISGLRLYTDNCLLVSAAGPDFYDKYSPWFQTNGLSTDGVVIKTKRTAYQILRYRPDGVYEVEHPFGNVFTEGGTVDLRPQPEEVLRFSKHAKGVYVHMSPDGDHMKKMLEGRKKLGFKLCWEYIPASPVSDGLRFLRERGSEIDILSINYPESCDLFGISEEDELIAAMKELHLPFVLFRVGERGLYTIAGGKHWFVPSVGSIGAVDPTGCGNCSTGASLYAYCEGYDPLMVGILSNVAASYNVLQYGPYPKYTDNMRKEAFALAQQIYNARPDKP